MRNYISICVFLLITNIAKAQEDTMVREEKRFSLHYQTTYIYQYKPAFHSPYQADNSLTGTEEKQNSLTATLYAGVRLWKGANIFINPELAGGSALSGAFGMGGSTNGETFRVGNPSPTLYLARAYFMQEFKLGDEDTWIEDGANAVAQKSSKDYLRFYIGKYSIGDLFDNNNLSNSPRNQFLNWSLMNTGAWDYAADVRGYTYSLTTELEKNNFNYKLSIAAMPTTANGAKLNTDFSESYAINASVSKKIFIKEREGNYRILVFCNTANMGNYQVAMDMAPIVDTVDVIGTRKAYRRKYGFAISADQQLTNTLGAFLRIRWNDGKNETWAFTEIDRTLALGININGKQWKRNNDEVGVGFVMNGLSREHRRYLNYGGYGFVLGDGKLNYSIESILEIYYNFKPTKLPIWFSGDYQFALNPGYNKDRGPVSVFSVRAHVEF